MNKVLKFFREKYKVLIPIMVAVVLIVTIFFLYKEYHYDNYKNKVEEKVYQFFGGQRLDYTAIVTYNLRDAIVDVKPKDVKIDYDSTPIYYQDSNKVLFLSEMNAVFPRRENGQYRVYKYATYWYDEETENHYIKNNTNTNDYDLFFLYDGKYLFFFPEEVKVKINDEVYAELGAMSYVSLYGGTTLIYYDKATDTSKFLEISDPLKQVVTVENENLRVNLSENYYMLFGSRTILVKPEDLTELFE